MDKKKFAKKRHSAPLMQYKVLAILLYGAPTGMQKVKGTIVLSTPEFCRSVGIMRCRLVEHLDELERLMLIDNYSTNGAMVKFDLMVPMGYTTIEE